MPSIKSSSVSLLVISKFVLSGYVESENGDTNFRFTKELFQTNANAWLLVYISEKNAGNLKKKIYFVVSNLFCGMRVVSVDTDYLEFADYDPNCRQWEVRDVPLSPPPVDLPLCVGIYVV